MYEKAFVKEDNMTKPEFRHYCLQKLRSVAAHSRFKRNKMLNRRLFECIAASKARSVLLFWPLDSEPDVREVIRRLRAGGVAVYLPFMEGASFRMVPFRYPLERKKFGIFEPGNSHKNIKKIDLAVVPAVGVDAQARRIGFGKGMYDRFFAALKKKPVTIFVQLEGCTTQEKICDDYDVSADVLLTPTDCFKAAGMTYDKRNTLRRCNRHG